MSGFQQLLTWLDDKGNTKHGVLEDLSSLSPPRLLQLLPQSSQQLQLLESKSAEIQFWLSPWKLSNPGAVI